MVDFKTVIFLIYRFASKIRKKFKRESAEKSDSIAAHKIFVTGEKINSSGSIEPNFPQFEDQFRLRCKITCIYRNGIVHRHLSQRESLAPLLFENSVSIKFSCAKILMAFKILSTLAKRVQSEKKEYKELFTRNDESDTLGSFLLYLSSATIACVTLHCVSK